MKTYIKIFIILIIAIFVLDRFVLNPSPVEDVVVITPEETGVVEKKLDSVRIDTVFIEVPGKTIKEIVVDSTYKARYESAVRENDTLKSKNLFLEAISINEYKDTIVDNKDIEIIGHATTRGILLDFKVNYKIKSDTLTYKPITINELPKLSLVAGVTLGIPTIPIAPAKPFIEVHAGIMNKKGNIWTIGYDSQERVLIGFSKTFKLF